MGSKVLPMEICKNLLKYHMVATCLPLFVDKCFKI